MNDMTEPVTAAAGDRIEHDLMPGFVMVVQETRACQTDWNRDRPHLACKITDPAGETDWLCAYEIHKAPGDA